MAELEYDTAEFLGTDTTPEEYACAMKVDPELLDREFPGTADAYLRFGKLIPNWLALAPQLGLRQGEIFTIKSDLGLTDGMHAEETLKKWKVKKGFKAKYGQLVKVYLGLDRTVAKEICLAIHDYCAAVPESIRRSPAPTQRMPTQKYVYWCTKVESRNAPPDVNPVGVAHGIIRQSRVWDKKLLKVFFMNPNVLVKDHWKFDGKPLTTTIILAWATYWNSHAAHYPKIQITEALVADEAEIRVLFNPPDNISNYSRVGAEASQVSKKEHTMALNLNVNGMTDKAKRSMVLHEFGHALGLEHEHQRSDFWEVLGKEENGVKKFIIGESEMRRKRAVSEHFKEDTPAPTEVFHRSDYDSKSIMHYWFDVEWLLPQYRDQKRVNDDPDLTRIEKRVLNGVHDRDYDNGQLAEDPSELDYEVLNKAYGPRCHVDESPDQSFTSLLKFQGVSDSDLQILENEGLDSRKSLKLLKENDFNELNLTRAECHVDESPDKSFTSWLQLKGVADRDLQVLESEGYSTVQSFKLLKEEDFKDMKDMNLTRAGKKLIPQLLEELGKGAGPTSQAPPPSSGASSPTTGPGTSDVPSSSDSSMLNPGADPENGE